ncbi:MAG: hypothetical protein DMF83_26865 [Acidobacteria bacterium]|nr:MAG: hypothetical protein DMF83_26865 [Acidobacteriota bacterium]
MVRLHHLAQDVARRQPAPAAGRRAVHVAGDAAQPLDDVEEPRLAADGEVEARVAVGDDVEPRHLLLADETRHRVEVLLAEARVTERVLEAAPAQFLDEPLRPRIGAGDRRRQHEVAGGAQHGTTLRPARGGVKPPCDTSRIHDGRTPVATLEIRTAEELADPALEARWAARRADRETDVLQRILRSFVERGGPIPVDDIVATFPDDARASVHDTLRALDDDDLIRVRDGHVDVAYPFAAAPTSFVIRLPDGAERYACCATDALGIAPMLGLSVHIGTKCHHCQAPLNFSVSPDAGPEVDGVMVWFEKQADHRGRALDSL